MGQPLLQGNHFTCLRNGDQAYPRMLEAIDTATTSITLCTYIFNADPIGQRFLETLANAVARGVQVRVLVDDVGSRYGYPRIFSGLKRYNIPHAAFLPSWLPWELKYVNLRNHRKILVIDGQSAFVGGINIQAAHLLSQASSFPVRDLHFQIQGPVVQQIQQGFADDWLFAAKETLTGTDWFPSLDMPGTAVARALCDGPDDDFDQLRHILFAAFTTARQTIRIVTPYFVPDQLLLTALKMAAIRGVEVEIMVPENNNLALVKWASASFWQELLQVGARVWFDPGPFDHAKLLVIDEEWCLFGSGNMDNRSLTLNFEINIESYDRSFCAELLAFIREKRNVSRLLTQKELLEMPRWRQIRNQVAGLLGPLL